MVNVALVRDSGATDFAFSYPDYEAYRDAVQSLSGLVAFRLAQLTLSSEGASAVPELVKLLQTEAKVLCWQTSSHSSRPAARKCAKSGSKQ